MSKIIFLDAGHGGTDPGAIGGSRYEKNDNLRLAKAVQSLLQGQGCNVVMSRTSDTTVKLEERPRMANAAGASLFISLHRNSFTNATANGVETWIYSTSADISAANKVHNRLVAVGAQSNRGVKQGNYCVLRESNMASMLIELGFISNTKDNQLFDQNFNAYAKAIADGAMEALGITGSTGGNTKPPVTTEPPATGADIAVGDIVQFTGGNVYTSSTSTTPSGGTRTASRCKVTALAKGAAHPYHLVSVDDGGNVYGWVNASAVKESSGNGGDTTFSVKEGTVVQFTGGNIYASSAQSSPSGTRPASRCKVTKVAHGAAHPYHLVSEDSGGVYAWVDASNVKATQNKATSSISALKHAVMESTSAFGKN